MNLKTRLIVRAAMTEYMILMSGAIILYAALQAWPHSTLIVSITGGLAIAALCVVNFFLVMRNSDLEQSRPQRRSRNRH